MASAGRPEQPLDPSAGPLSALASELRVLRRRKGLTYLKLSDETGLARSTLSAACNGRDMPSRRVVDAIVLACGDAGDAARVEALWKAAGRAAGRLGREPDQTVALPDPGSAATAAEFVQAMRDLRGWAGDLSLAQLNRRAGGHNLLPPSTLNGILQRNALPRRKEVVSAFVRACGLDEEHVQRWEIAWEVLRQPDPARQAPVSGITSAVPVSPAPSRRRGSRRRLARAAWVAAVLVPVAGALAVWLSGNQVLLVAVALLYALMVCGLIWPAIWARGDRRMGLLKGIEWRAGGVAQRYRNSVRGGLRYVDQRGLATVGASTPQLDEVFVDVALIHSPPHDSRAGLLDGMRGDDGKRYSLASLLDKERPAALAVIGAPGSGKTTLLRHIARQAAESGRSRRRNVPILLFLRDHAETVAQQLAIRLPELAAAATGSTDAEALEGWLEAQLSQGRCLVLLDGLDEIADLTTRRAVADWVERVIAMYPGNDFVITSRPMGYQAAPVAGLDILQACGFTAGQVECFIRSWYLAVERHATGSAGEETQRRAEEGAMDLLARLRSAPGLGDLTASPLLLTMIANVHRYRGALPGSRADLYSEICQVMLWRRQQAKKLAVEPSGSQRQKLLQYLAYEMMRRGVRDLAITDVAALIKPQVRRVSAHLTVEDFIADICSGGLLVERAAGLYAFAHLGFQEYLAAAHIRDLGMVDELAATVNDPWWHETALLYAANNDADPIVEACLKAGTASAVGLAFECAEQHSDLSPELLSSLDQLLLAAGDEAAAPERGRLAAAVLLARLCRQTARLGDGSAICTSPVPAVLYQAFARQHQLQVQQHLAVAEPATVDGPQVTSFVHWLSDLADHHLRLPTVPELVDRQPALDCGVAVWATDPARTQLIAYRRTSDGSGDSPASAPALHLVIGR